MELVSHCGRGVADLANIVMLTTVLAGASAFAGPSGAGLARPAMYLATQHNAPVPVMSLSRRAHFGALAGATLAGISSAANAEVRSTPWAMSTCTPPPAAKKGLVHCARPPPCLSSPLVFLYPVSRPRTA